jgi:hypothetical protein
MQERPIAEYLVTRPWLNQPKYDSSMCTKLVEMMWQGCHVSEICRALFIHRSTFYDYLNEFPEFKAAYELGKTLAEGWHYQQGRINLDNPDFNAIVWQMIGRLRFGFSEHRNVKLDNFESAKTYTEKLNVLNAALSRGELTPIEFNNLSSAIAQQARVEEVAELKSLVETLETKLNQRG